MIQVACGTAVSYAITEQGDCLSWGMGTNGQLGTGEEVNIEISLTTFDINIHTRKMCMNQVRWWENI